MFSFALNKSLFYLFIFTAVSSFFAYKIVVKAYSGVYDENSYESMIIRAK